MTVLSVQQRKLLSDVVVRAREVAESACGQRIAALGVAADKAPVGLEEADRVLRVGLRARARQLGSVDALVTEAAFEHWHRMLFARFLVDNGLLVHPKFEVSVTMDEIAEFASETGQSDLWEVAAEFAAQMLPGIFRQGDPILAMRLPVEARQELESLLDQLPAEVIRAEDSLGWVYQYWQTKRKNEVNDSERKIGGADLAPVTQLFTENYMVRFLLENSLGAWWAARHPDSPLISGWEYLRRNDDGGPVVGGFESWPECVAEVTVMDPCCGSGHFLTAAFGMLWRMRAEEEALEPVDAQDAVLRDNLFGLELDSRCTQIATFSLVLEAWKAGGYRRLPVPNVACSGIPARAPLEDWLGLAGGDSLVETALTRLHELFTNADTLGSLIDPVRATEQAGLESVDWAAVAPLVQEALTAETGKQGNDPAAAVFGEAAAGIARAANYLSRKYTLIATNVPFLSQKRFSTHLATYVSSEFPDAGADLATAFLSRYAPPTATNIATCATVSPQAWMTLGRYRRLRERLIASTQMLMMARLGAGAFSGISGEVVKPVLAIWTLGEPGSKSLVAIDRAESVESLPAEYLLEGELVETIWKLQSENPESRIILGDIGAAPLLAERANAYAGIQAGDLPRFGRLHWEVPRDREGWAFWQGTVRGVQPYAGREQIFLWQDGKGQYYEYLVQRLGPNGVGAWMRGREAWGRSGVVISQMGSLPATLYTGELWDPNCAAIIPHNDEDLPAIWAYCSSPEFADNVRAIDQSLKVTNKTLIKVPFDIQHWHQVATETYPDGLPNPYSDDPTQWLFRGGVRGSRNALQVAVARLLGFRWPDQEPDELDEFADADGIVCLPALRGEKTAEERLRALLVNAYGSDWDGAMLQSLLNDAGAKPGKNLEKWLRDGFFKDHCKVFANRPFIWQIWDGRPDGFSALVYYHKLDRKLLESLTYDYLGSWWIRRLNDEVGRDVPGAEARLAAAQELKAKLELILQGEPPYDIFVRWKSLAEQPLGWDPDLDDGVRLNIRPFMTAGVLRFNPNIKWNKDRGKNPDGSERLNDLHYTLAEKRQAREGTT